ncbi:MAG: hypothetical protein JWQ04_3149 [Pedosphaera sp.]|nr:hypothetical protein [Pedosphaera sp.]
MSRNSKDIAAWFPPQHPRTSGCADQSASDFSREADWPGWVPLIVLPVVPLGFQSALPAWVLMWALALALFFGCKWLTWWRCRSIESSRWRHWAYLFAWPGMDAKAFLDASEQPAKPTLRAWIAGFIKTAFGVLLVWKVARLIPVSQPLLAGWIGLFGLVLVLHFGTFHLLALAWQQAGINAQPLMRAPMMATSLADFWGHRWNSAFNRLVQDLLFRRVHRRLNVVGATLAVFFVSGMIHDLVISVPARGGYGLPTAYFLLQGLGLLFERSELGRKWGLRRGLAGRSFTVAVTAVPAYWLFHPPFINNVILPMLRVIGAT